MFYFDVWLFFLLLWEKKDFFFQIILTKIKQNPEIKIVTSLNIDVREENE